jgi:Flp pilus assembly protein TadG
MRIGKFCRQTSGLAAVEFALLLPIMLSFFLGLIEVSQALTCRASVTDLAATGSDLVAQESTVTTADMTNVFNALSALLFPFDATKAQITITSIVDNNTATTGKVAWSCTHGGTARAVNSVVTVPSGIIVPGGGGSVILAEVNYAYASSISTYFVKNVTMTNSFYSKPRLVSQISLVACP